MEGEDTSGRRKRGEAVGVRVAAWWRRRRLQRRRDERGVIGDRGGGGGGGGGDAGLENSRAAAKGRGSVVIEPDQ